MSFLSRGIAVTAMLSRRRSVFSATEFCLWRERCPGAAWQPEVGGLSADGWRGFLAPEARLDPVARECLLLSPRSTRSFLAIPKTLHPHPLPYRNLPIALGDGGPERPSVGEPPGSRGGEWQSQGTLTLSPRPSVPSGPLPPSMSPRSPTASQHSTRADTGQPLNLSPFDGAKSLTNPGDAQLVGHVTVAWSSSQRVAQGRSAVGEGAGEQECSMRWTDGSIGLHPIGNLLYESPGASTLPD